MSRNVGDSVKNAREVRNVTNMVVRRQVSDLLEWVQKEASTSQLVQIDSLKFVRPSHAQDTFCLILQLHFSIPNPQALGGTLRRIEFAIRIPSSYPAESPVISCIQGGEHIPPVIWPDGAEQNSSKPSMPPERKKLIYFVQEVCRLVGGYNSDVLVRRDHATHCTYDLLSHALAVYLSVSIGYDCNVNLKTNVQASSSQSVLNTFGLQALEDEGESDDRFINAVFSPAETTIDQVAPWTSRIREEVNLIKMIGAGSSCKVYLANWRGTEVATKIFTGCNNTASRAFNAEVSTIALVGSHPSLVMCFAMSLQPLSIVMEYLPFSLL
uniref:Uncharacterized protein AlNc14C89G5637 n=1 Tax=Albugo laibachii Nc14 TaxID=890382 RepID=F0WGA7_9STRA|nr:hypothetical protein PITG_03584 [Albugo laibachii Nc14]|eukprot:CCA20242.1 hypothetical protein PITG_03584 [Albugo laibachii Nc14]